MSRSAGVLLHVTSLPGSHGIGEIGGPELIRWLDWLQAAGVSIWQVLPMGPVDATGSPYASRSAFARNPLLISMDDLVTDGLLRADEIPAIEPAARIDYGAVLAARTPALELAASRVDNDRAAFAEAHPWLRDWSLFAAIAEQHGADWWLWPPELRDRGPAVQGFSERAEIHATLQFLFDLQWRRLRQQAAARGIALWGDLPIFVGGASADTWARRDLFRLDAEGRATHVSGVPPDYFSETGQRWGHPLYDEAAHKAEGYQWWGDRVAAQLEHVDIVRIDHFRGFAAYWEVPARDEDARNGHWVPGPGQGLLDALRTRFGKLPVVAEDLGVITPDVSALRDDNGLPGMAILQFGLGDASGASDHLPHRLRPHQVVYPGTHDNPPVAGWFADLHPDQQRAALTYVGGGPDDIASSVLRATFATVCDTAIAAMQDVLAQGNDARMNIPGQTAGNWGYRVQPDQLDASLADGLARLIRVTGRSGPSNG